MYGPFSPRTVSYRFLTKILVDGLLAGLVACLFVGGGAPCFSQEEFRLANEYVAWVRDVDGSIGGDWGALLGDAKALDARLRERLDSIEKEADAARRPVPAGIQRVDKRFLRDEDIVLAVESLGDTSVRLQVALAWVDYSLTCENFASAQARKEAAQRNWQEACRVFADYQAQIAARQQAMDELWLLRTGQGRVQLQSGGTGAPLRQATLMETQWFANQRAQFAMSSIQVAPPQWTRIKDLWSRDRLVELTKKQPQLRRLRGMVHQELDALKKVHLEQVRKSLDDGPENDRLLALGSLGWWTDHTGIKLIHEGLNQDAEDPRHTAALTALERLHLPAKGLATYAKHKSPTVRLAVARQLRHRVGEGPACLPPLQDLSIDAHASVRQAAFESAENLFNLGWAGTVYQVRWGGRAVKSRDRETMKDGIRFLSNRTQSLDGPTAKTLFEVLGPVARSSDQELSQLAMTALKH